MTRAALLGLALILALAAPLRAQDMPDPSQIHGRAIPAPELAAGTVTVRVVRENIGNNLPGQQVQVTVGGVTRTAATDELGRAEFTGLPAGEARAEVTVDGERLESQPFPVPTTGGLRVILISGIAEAAERRKAEEAAEAAAPAVKGAVVFAGESRVLMEIRDDELWVFYLLDIVNNARTRVDTGGPVIIQLPETALNVNSLEGSSPSVQINGTRVSVAGPFAAGTTPVRVGFNFPYRTPDIEFEQALPVALQQLTVGVQKVGNLSIESPQFTTVNEVRTEGGTPFALGSGPGLQPGTALRLTIKGLPLRSEMPRYVALTLALGIVLLGVWLAVSGRSSKAQARAALVKRRDSLLGEVAQLETKRRRGEVGGDRYLTRRQKLMRELEEIYGELDDAVGPQGGGEGAAA